MVGDSCLARPLRCSVPGDRVRGLMGAGLRRGELLARRRDELMEGLLSDDCSWQLLRDAWIEGLLREEERPAGTVKTRHGHIDQSVNAHQNEANKAAGNPEQIGEHVEVMMWYVLHFPACSPVPNPKHYTLLCDCGGRERCRAGERKNEKTGGI